MSTNNTTSVQNDPEVLAYQFRNEKVCGEKTIGFGSPIYLGKGATDEGLTFSEINQMVSNHEAVCFLNGTLNVWKKAVGGKGESQRKLG